MTDSDIRESIVIEMERERDRRGISCAAMARVMEMDESAYKRLLYRQTAKISLSVAIRLSEVTGKSIDNIINRKSAYSNIEDKFRVLSQRQKDYINAIVDLESALKSEITAVEELSVIVPTGDMSDGMILDSANVERVNVGGWLKTFPSVSCGIRITSNNLLPTYCRDDILLVSCNPIRHGDTGIFVDVKSGRAYIRKFWQGEYCKLSPVNNYGETFYVNSSSPEDMTKWVKFGYVVSKIRV